jgi:hypothetical protein
MLYYSNFHMVTSISGEGEEGVRQVGADSTAAARARATTASIQVISKRGKRSEDNRNRTGAKPDLGSYT